MRTGGPEQLRPEACGVGDHELDRDAFNRHAERAPCITLEHRNDCGERLERVEQGLGLRGRADDGEVERRIRPAAWITCHLAAEYRCDLLEQGTRPVQQHASALRAALLLERVQHSPLRLRADAGNGGQASFTCRCTELVRGRDAEGSTDLHHPLRPDAQVAPEPDELWLHLSLELVQLRDASGLDELLQACGDARSDSTQLLHPPGGDEVRDRRLRLTDRLRRPPVCARGVVAGARKVEQPREGFELLGDRCVVKGVRHGLVSLAA